MGGNPKAAPGSYPPAIRTVKNNIRAEHIAWREANALRTK